MKKQESTCCPKHIKGITCNVENCTYHDSHNVCMAEQIAVGPTNACTSAETVCVTFRPKTEM